jgi:dTDP-4-dehydrorhamnose 3,5-epimerase-like enzyme
VLHIPAGYANGMKALEPGAQLLVYSDQDLEAARHDDWRFNADLWLDWTKY